MLKKYLLFALVAVSLALASASDYPSKPADMDLLIKQKKIYDLFMYVSQEPLHDTEYYEIGHHYDIFSNLDRYTHPEVVHEFLLRYKLGMLHKDSLFTYYDQVHREELIMLYRLFYCAKDFSTFYKTAAWARIYLNSGLFVTAFTAAITYREDTKYISFPAIFEVCPNVFFDSKMIHDAHYVAMTRGVSFGHHLADKKVDAVDTVETYHLYSNFSNSWLNYAYDSEYPLAYFTHDVQLNAYYYYFRMMFPFWMSVKDYDVPKTMRGEIYLFIHQQLMARYHLERISNGFSDFEDFTFEKFTLPPFYYSFTYPNGVAMPRRDWWNMVPQYKLKYFEYLKKLEVRIMEAIDSGFFYDDMGKQIHFYTPEGLNYLGNLIEGNYDSMNFKYYGAFDALARNVFGMDYHHYYKDYHVPSSLHFFSTSMKDPAFYRIYYKIVQFYLRYKSLMTRYTKSELEFSGVRFESVEVSKLITYFENKDYLINNAVSVGSFKEGRSFAIKGWQYQLNFKPFSFKFCINSDKTTKGVVRIFLGPASHEDYYDDYSYFLHYYKYFFMLDEFEVNLREGMNNFEHFSKDFFHVHRPYYSFDKFYKKISQAIEGKEPFTLPEHEFTFPYHLYLPKGTPEGMKFKFFFYIGPYEDSKSYTLPMFGKRVFYNKSFGFPLDRPMKPFFFKLDNVFLKDVFIYHKKDYEYSDHYERSYHYGHEGHFHDHDYLKLKDLKNVETESEDFYDFRVHDTDTTNDLHMMHI